MQIRAAEDLRKLVTEGLVEGGLSYAHARAFSTPRRLVLALEGLSAESPTLREDRKGPKVGAPQQALDGFLRSTGLTMDQLHIHEDKKGAFYVAHFQKPGRLAAEILAEVLEKTIRTFPWPKSMRWGSGSLRWVRPLHSIIALMVTEAGAEVVPLDIDGITAGNTTRGHRFMAPGAFTVSSFEDYAAKLKRAFVVLDAAERADMIEHEVKNRAFALGLDPIEDKGLLAEVAGLVEWPVVLMGTFDEAFLAIPPEVIRARRMAYYKAMHDAPKPSIAVIEDLDYPSCMGAYWGEINATVHKGFGIAGALTNGVVRDLGDLPPGFPVIAGSIGPSHGFVHVLSIGEPVRVMGLEVRQGDLIHADRHGALVVPTGVIPALASAIRRLHETERLVLGPARAPGFDFAAFEAAWTAFERART